MSNKIPQVSLLSFIHSVWSPKWCFITSTSNPK